MKANLHVHTTNSDGTKTVKEINDLAIMHGFDVVAITDHDNVGAIAEIKNLKTNVKFIIGVEVNSKYNNQMIHILGYFKDKVSSELKAYFDKMTKERLVRANKIIENLKTYYDIEIDYEDVIKRADGVVARPHIARAICEKYGYTIDEAFDKFIGDKAKAYVPINIMSLTDAIKLLKNNNALVVLAHPRLIKKINYKEIINMGFDGIEVYHPSHDSNFSKELIKVAKENGLFITGGSDYHGDIKENKFEENYIEGKDLDIFLDRLNNK